MIISMYECKLKVYKFDSNSTTMIGSIKNFVNSKFTPSEKDFESKGVLSPDQFIQAGDQLTNFGWNWQKSLNKTNKLLSDPSKQFLMARATSNMRIKHLIM